MSNSPETGGFSKKSAAEAVPRKDEWSEALEGAPDALIGAPLNKLRTLNEARFSGIEALRRRVEEDPTLTPAQKTEFRLAAGRVTSQLTRLNKFGLNDLATREKTEPIISEIRSRESEFTTYLKNSLPQLVPSVPSAAEQPVEDPSAIDSTPAIEFTREDREYLKQSRGMTDAEVDAMDYDARVDFFHDRYNEVEAASAAPAPSPYEALGWSDDALQKLPQALKEKILAENITFDQAMAPAAASEAVPLSASQTTAEQDRALSGLGWKPEQMSKFDSSMAQRIIDRNLKPEDVAVSPLAGNAPEAGTTGREETTAELKTRMRSAILALDGLSKEQQKEKYARVFSERTSARESHQQEIVALMEDAARKNAIAEEAIRAHFKKSNVVMNSIRDFDLKDYLPKDVQEKRDQAERARHAVLARTLGTVRERRAARGGDPAYDERVNDRFTRRFGILQRVVVEPMKAEQRAREEALKIREKGAIESWIEKRYNAIPPYQRVFATSAVVTLAVAGVTGAGVLVPLALGGAAAAATFASSFLEKKGLGKTAARGVASAASIAGIFGFTANILVRGLHHIAGTERKAKEKLESEGLIQSDGSFVDMADWETYKKQLEEYRLAFKAEKEVARDAALFGGVGAAVAGQTIGHEVAELMGHQSAGEHPGSSASSESDTVTQTAGPAVESAPAAPAAVSADTAAVPSEGDAGSPAEAEPAPEVHAGVVEAGEGADAAFSDLQAKLRAEYADVAPEDMPQVVKEVLGAESPNELSREFGFAWGDESRTMYEGDTISVEDGKLVYSHGGEKHVLMDEAGKHALPHAEAPPSRAAGPEMSTEPPSPAREEVAPVSDDREGTPVQTSAEEPVEEVSAAPPAAEPARAAAAGEAAPAPRSYTSADYVSMADGSPEGASASPAEGIPQGTNPFGVTIDPSEGRLYSFRLPGTDQEYVAVFGGRQDALDDVALTYLKEHPDAVVLFDSPQTELDGSTSFRLDAFELGPDGRAVPVPGYTDGTIPPGTRLDPDQFTRPIRP